MTCSYGKSFYNNFAISNLPQTFSFPHKTIYVLYMNILVGLMFLCLCSSAPEELHSIIQEVKYRTGLQSAKLIRQLRRRDRLCHKLQKNYDIVTACLQAVSQKRRKNTQLSLCFDAKTRCFSVPLYFMQGSDWKSQTIHFSSSFYSWLCIWIISHW